MIIYGLFTICAAVLLWRWYCSATFRRVPPGLKELPGPSGYPLVGNFFEFPKEFAYKKFKEWSDKYGDIYKIDILGNTHIILSSNQVANDLLALKGAIYSDRPHSTMAYELVSHNGNLGTSPMNKYWRNSRKFTQAVLSTTAAEKWQAMQAAEVKRLVCDLLAAPENYNLLFERYSTAVTLQQAYGKTMSSDTEERRHVDTIMTIVRTLERTAAPGAYLVDFIPALKHLPDFLATFKREARELFQFEYTYFKGLVTDSRKRYDADERTDPRCFAHAYFDDERRWDLSDFEFAYLLGTLFEGGSGTTSSTMQTYCLAMCHYPEWQAQLQKELDNVVGPLRLPEFNDMPNLPTVRAVMKELLRWRPVVPAGIPHFLTQDDEYNGYFIPKGSIVHANQFAMNRDEATYPDAETFNPDRWLNAKYPTFQEPLTRYPNLKRFTAFGFGRRICPGLETAERGLFIQISTIAWACHISLKKDKDGKVIPVHWNDYTAGINTAPKLFQFDLKARDTERIHLLKSHTPTG